MKRRKVYPGEVHHVCQKTEGKVVIFYSQADYLVFFSIFCTVAERMGIPILALCPMPDHLHQVCIAYSQRQLADFVREYSRLFARAWNDSRERTGPLFHHNFCSAVKMGAKQVRTTLAYNYNNPVERKIVRQAEDYRWNFLAYARNAAPFSAPFVPRNASKSLRNALKEAEICREEGKYLNYAQLGRWQKTLSSEERQQLTDQLIDLWNIIDYQKAIDYYGSLEGMTRAFHDNTGSEWDIPEDRDNYSDAVYADCTTLLLQKGLVGTPREIPNLSPDRKQELSRLFDLNDEAYDLIDEILGPPEEELSVEEMLRQFPAARKGRAN